MPVLICNNLTICSYTTD